MSKATEVLERALASGDPLVVLREAGVRQVLDGVLRELRRLERDLQLERRASDELEHRLRFAQDAAEQARLGKDPLTKLDPTRPGQ